MNAIELMFIFQMNADARSVILESDEMVSQSPTDLA